MDKSKVSDFIKKHKDRSTKEDKITLMEADKDVAKYQKLACLCSKYVNVALNSRFVLMKNLPQKVKESKVRALFPQAVGFFMPTDNLSGAQCGLVLLNQNYYQGYMPFEMFFISYKNFRNPKLVFKN